MLPQLEANTRMRRQVFAVVTAAALAAGCSSGTNPLSPTSPSFGSIRATAQGGPAGYDATGRWFGLVFIEGSERVGSGVHIFTQEPSGSLTAVGSEAPDDPERDHGIYTFKRIGSPNGTVRNFRFSLHMDAQQEGACGRDLSGTAQLDTQTNTIVATGTGTLDHCGAATVSFKWVKQ